MDKHTKPLFEIIRQSQQKNRLRLPQWLTSLADGSDDPHPLAPRAEGGSGADEPKVVHPTASEEVAAAERKVVAWASRPVGFRLPVGVLVALGVAVTVLVLGIFMLALQMGKAAASRQEQEYDRAAAGLQELRQQAPKPVIPATVEGVEASAAKAAGKTLTATGEAADPRQPGLNYFRLTVMPASAREELLRALAFLKASGVDATIIPVNNGGSLKLVALQGFSRPLSDPQAIAHKSQLQTLGRKWKAQHKGSSDWKDLFPEKYKPGVN